MLVRGRGEGALLVSQPAHAWIAGVLAEAWGAGAFACPEPRPDILCAAALHDIGWLDWEERPELDAETGWPREFLRVPAERHVELWRQGVTRAEAYGLWPALLVSRHGVAIYDRTFDPATSARSAVEAVTEFRAEQAVYQRHLVARLRTGSAREGASPDPDALDRATRFIVAVDTMSLQLCWGLDHDVEVRDVPDASGQGTDLLLRPGPSGVVTCDPWPFAPAEVNLRIPARHLTARVQTQAALDAALATAEPTTIVVRLRREPDAYAAPSATAAS